MAHGKPGKSWKLSVCHGKSWKMKFIVKNIFNSCFFFREKTKQAVTISWSQNGSSLQFLKTKSESWEKVLEF